MINYKISDLALLDEYLKLYEKSFKNFNKKKNYFDWLYLNNPMGKFIGIDVFDKNKLIGQVGGVPYDFIFKKKKIKTLISINVCVSKNYQGKKLFSNLTKRLEKLLIENNFELLIAIGNKAATPAWIKSINLKLLCNLQAKIGIGHLFNFKFNPENYDLFVNWNKKTIKWRSLNPYNNTKLIRNYNNNYVVSNTHIPYVKSIADVVYLENGIEEFKKEKYLTSNLKLYLGLFNHTNKNNFFFNIPEFLKPSPLNFLYKFLKKDEKLIKEKVYFTFLDFDAF